MGILNAFRRGGGGFLNNVDGVVIDYQFTTDPDFGGDRGERAERADKSTPLWVKLTVKQDGAEATESTHLDAGAADEFVISDDGHTLEPVDPAAKLWGGTSWLKFVESAVTNGVDEPAWEPGQPIAFLELIGQRVRFVQVKDEERMARSAKDFKAGKGKAKQYYNAEGQKKGKDGKFYDQRTLQVSQVYGKVATTAASTPAATTAKKTTTRSKVTPPAPADTTSSVKDFAGEVLNTILSSAKDRKLSKSKMNYEVTRLFATPAYRERVNERDDVRKFLYEDGNLEAFAAEGFIGFDKSSKDQTISLA